MKRAVLATFFLVALSCLAWAQHGEKPSISPEQALQMLKDGNTRFTEGKRTYVHQDSARLRETAEKGQTPFVTVLACSDSRVPVEHIFDAGVGDIFVIRIAGNTCNLDQAASLEYGAEHLRTPLIVVMGHTGCGAVRATVEDAKLTGNEPEILRKIKPAVERTKAKNDKLSGVQLCDAVSTENVWLAMEDILKTSHLIRDLVRKGEASLVGAIYDINTGKVVFLGPHRDEKKLLGEK